MATDSDVGTGPSIEGTGKELQCTDGADPDHAPGRCSRPPLHVDVRTIATDNDPPACTAAAWLRAAAAAAGAEPVDADVLRARVGRSGRDLQAMRSMDERTQVSTDTADPGHAGRGKGSVMEHGPATPTPPRGGPRARVHQAETPLARVDTPAPVQAEPDRTHLAVIAADVSAPPVGPAALLHLQRTAGNGAVARLLGRSTPSPTLVAQRVALGIRADPRDKESGLDTDDLPGIKSYVVEMAGQGRRDLLNILLDRVRAKASDALATVQGYVDAAEFVEAPTKAVPDTVHVIWMGERIRKEAVDNIVSLHGKATRLTLWTDSRKRGFLASPTAAPLVTLAEKSKTFAVRNVDDVIDKRLTNTYALALQRNAYSMASDLARHSILLSQGGVYMDVDLSFRAVKSLSDLKMPEHGLPLLGPNIRDVGAQEQVLSGDVGSCPSAVTSACAQVPAPLAGDVTAVVDRASARSSDSRSLPPRR